MTTAVIGATGRVGSKIVRGLRARGDPVAALIRDPDKARRAFGEADGLHIRPTNLDDPRDLTEAWMGCTRCSSRWDQSGSRAYCSASPSTLDQTLLLHLAQRGEQLGD